MFRKEIGNQAETEACAYLQQQGLKLVEKNFDCDIGEIDLIMRDGNGFVFVEVKHRANEDFATVVEQITPDQCRRIRRVAQYYLLEKKLNEHVTPMRFDVVTITARPAQLTWLPDAF